MGRGDMHSGAPQMTGSRRGGTLNRAARGFAAAINRGEQGASMSRTTDKACTTGAKAILG